MKRKIIVTGGIASGKSTACQILSQYFEWLGSPIEVISVDEIVKKIYNDPFSEVGQKIYQTFGTSSKEAISAIVFNDPDMMSKLKAITDDFITEEINYQIADVPDYVPWILEFPLYPVYKKFADSLNPDIVINISSPNQLSNLIARDKVSTTLATTKIKSQPSALSYKNSATDTIEFTSTEDLKSKLINSLYSSEEYNKKDSPEKTGIVSGSFDPITNGHLWVIKNASEMVDKLYIVIASNSSKKPLFSLEERKALVLNSLAEVGLSKNIEVVIQPENQLLVTTATALAKYVFRGIRNFTDFEYENTLNFVNKKLNPDVETIFLIPPKELSDISSSTVKALMKYPQWKTISAGFICKTIEQALEKTAKDSI